MSGWNGYSEQGTGSEERGPASFALNIPGVVQSSAGPAGQAVAVQGGVRGQTAGVTATVRTEIPAYEDATSALLMKMGEKFVAKQINKRRDEQFLKGVQQAASGKALVDIVNEQPWYTKIFGDVPMVEGARSYEVSTRASKWAAEQQLNMGKLREVSPDALPQLIIQSTDKLLTGDAAADMQFKAEVLKRLPGLIEQQTKEHYKWGQEKLRKTAADNIAATATEAQQVLSNPDPAISSPETRKAVQDRVFAAFTPPVGMDDVAAERMVVDGVIGAAEAGNWHTVGILREAGVFERLSPEKRNQLQNYIQQQANEHRTRSAAALPYNIKSALLMEEAQAGRISAEQFLQRAETLNGEFSMETGNPAALISNLEAARGAGSAVQAVYNMIAAQQRAASSSSRNPEAERANLSQAALQGTLGLVMEDRGVSTQDANDAFIESFNVLKTMPNGSERQARMVIDNSKFGYTNPTLKKAWASGVTNLGEEPSPAFLQTYQKWSELRKHPDSAAARTNYLGAEMDARLESYDILMRGSPESPLTNYRSAMLGPNKPKALTKDEKAMVRKLVGSSSGGSWNPFANRAQFGPELNAASAELVQREVEGVVELYAGLAPQLGLEEVTKRAMSVSQANGLEVYGGYAWKGKRGQVPLTKLADMPYNELDAALPAVLKERGADERPVIYRLDDVGGVAQFEVVYTKDGLFKTTTFSSEDIKDQRQKLLEQKNTRKVTRRDKPPRPAPMTIE